MTVSFLFQAIFSEICVVYGDFEKALAKIIYFPYRGFLPKDRIDWSKIEPGVRTFLNDMVQHGLAVEQSDRYELLIIKGDQALRAQEEALKNKSAAS